MGMKKVKAVVCAALALGAWGLMVLLLGACHVDDSGWPRLGVVAMGAAAFVLAFSSVEAWRAEQQP